MNETPRLNKIDIFYTPMTKEEIKELQTNLISLVPSEIRKSKELTKSDKILLGQLVYLFGMDKAKANGYVFRSNADLKDDTQLSKRSVNTAISHLTQLGVVRRNVGSRAEGASVYTLNFELPQICESSSKSSPIAPKVAPKVALSNSPYMSTDEVEAMIEGLRAEFQQQINDLRDEIAELKGLKSDEASVKVARKSSPMLGKSSPQIQNSEKEPYHIQPYSNPIESNDYRADAGETDFNEIEGNTNDGEVNPSNADEVVPSNEGDQTGSVSDFQKIEGGVDTFQPDEATPDDEQKTIDYLNELETTLRDSNTNLNHDEVIALAGELSANLNKWGQSSNVGKLTIDRSANLINWFVDDLTTLAEVRDIFASHLRSDNGNLNQIANNLTLRYGNLNPQYAGNAQIWAIATSDVQTTTDDPKGDQKRNKGANPVSGNTDLNPQDEETHQTSENKAAGSVSAPQMGELSTDDEKHAQNAPESPRMEMQEVPCIKAELTVWGRCEFDIHDNEMAESDADNAVNNLTKLIGCIKTVAELNWCEYYIGRAFKKWGWVLGTRYEMYHSNITRQLAAKRNELCAA